MFVRKVCLLQLLLRTIHARCVGTFPELFQKADEKFFDNLQAGFDKSQASFGKLEDISDKYAGFHEYSGAKFALKKLSSLLLSTSKALFLVDKQRRNGKETYGSLRLLSYC